MPAPSLVISVPSNGASSVAKNVVVKLTFAEALDPDSVNGKTVQLWNSKFNSLVESAVTLSSDGLMIILTPDEHLFPDCGHRVKVIGEDVDEDCLKSADTTVLPLTFTIVFQTGDTIDAASDGKTTAEIEAEGDAFLPADFTVRPVAGAPLQLLQTTPGHNLFNLGQALDKVSFKFSAALDEATVTGNVLVTQMAFYEEESLRARETDLGQGDGERHYFLGETEAYTGDPAGYLDPNLFRDRAYELVTSGEWLFVVFEEDYLFPKNIALEITLGAELADTEGNLLGEDLVWFGCIEAYPRWTSLLDVKHTAGYTLASTLTDTFIGLRIWRATIDLERRTDWDIPTDNPTGTMREYVRYQASLDLWDDLLAQKALNSGTSKRLGDLEITVNTAAGSARPSSVRKMEEALADLTLNIFGGRTQTPRTGIKSILDPWEPGRAFFRSRLWKLEITSGRSPKSATAANTEAERYQPDGVPSGGYYGIKPRIGGSGSYHRFRL